MLRLTTILFCIYGITIQVFISNLQAEIKDGMKTTEISAYNALSQVNTTRTLSNINQFSCWFYWDGKSGIDPDIKSGGLYPRGTAGVIYMDGFVWGGFLLDPATGVPIATQPLRVGGSTYRTGTVPGYIDDFGNPVGPAQDPRIRIYRIRRDYLTVSDAQLARDASELLQKPLTEVSSSEIQELRSQYAADWNQWPAELGAPFYDLNQNGIYEPLAGETPGLANADQVIWFVTHDLDAAVTTNLYGSQPIGIEAQFTFWAYDIGGPLGQAIFRRLRLINKSPYIIDSTYISQWCDPELGKVGNDLAGCDTIKEIGFSYNAESHDVDFDEFNLPPPSIGYTLLQGPIVPSTGDTALFNFRKIMDFANRPMTSFGWFGAGSAFGGDPELGNYKGTKEWYNLLRGYCTISDDIEDPYSYLVGSGPNYGNPTKFPLSGDPVNDPNGLLGDVDGAGSNGVPADRRMNICTGPFTIEVGDTQEVVIALVGGIELGGNNLTSITRMKDNVDFIRSIYDTEILLPKITTFISSPTVNNTDIQVLVNLQDFGSVRQAQLNFSPEFGSEPGFNLTLFDDGLHNDSLAGDNIWGNQTTVTNRKYPFKADLDIQKISESLSYPSILDQLRLRPALEFSNWQIVWENGQQDSSINFNEQVHYQFHIKNLDAVNDVDSLEFNKLNPGANLQQFVYGQAIPAGVTVSDPNLYLVVTGPSQGDSMTYAYHVSYDHHSELISVVFPVVAWNPSPVWGDTLEVQSIVGNPGNVFPIVADPPFLTGHTYRINFFEDINSGDLLWRLIDATIRIIVLDSLEIATSPYYPHPVVDGIQWQVIGQVVGFLNFLAVANASGPLEPPEYAAFAFNNNGFPTLNGLPPDGTNDRPTDRQQVGPGRWGINVGGGPNDGTYATFLARLLRNDNADRAIPYDFEMRFTAAGGYGIWAFTSEAMVIVPFELWNIGIATPDDPSDDYRMIPWVLDEWWENNVYDFGTKSDGTGLDHGVSGGMNDPYLDWVYWRNPENTTPGTTGYDQFVIDALAGTYNYNSPEVMGRMVLVNWNGGDVTDPTFPANVNQLLPEEGTTFRILTLKPNFPGDSLLVIAQPSLNIAEKDIPATFYLYQNYPNPFNPETHIQFGLAQKMKVELMIYNVLGQQVKKLINQDMPPGNYEIIWDGRNDAGNRVGTGIYFYRIQAGDYIKSRKMVLMK
jgi:hypothetical protein